MAHLIDTMACGGIETAVLNWAKAMDRSRFQVELFCFASPNGSETPFVEAAAESGFAVERIPWSRWKPVLGAACEMAKQVRVRGIDVLHCHNTYAQLVTVVTGWLTGVKTITTFYVWGQFGWKRRMLQWADRFSAPFLDRISAPCEWTFAETVKRGIPAKRLSLLTSGFPAGAVELAPPERARLRRQLGAVNADIVLINVARFCPQKGHEVLLHGFRRVLRFRPDTWLWLAGSGPQEPAMRAIAERLHISGRTRFLGFRKDVRTLLALADIQVHPSDLEGVPLAVCEGMAAGLPIVATAVGGTVGLLRHGGTGVLIAPGHPEEVAEAVLALVDHPEKRRELGQAARRFIEEEYSLAAAAVRVGAVYEQMVVR